MAFQVHPNPPDAPLVVAAGSSTPLLPFAEHAGPDPETGLNTMFLRVVVVSAGCTPAGAPPPTIRLGAGSGDAVAVPTFPTTASIFDRPGQTGTHVADATVDAESDDVYRVRAFVFQAGSTWRLQIVNADPARAYAFTWVVADNDAQSRQPWVDMPTALAFEVVTGETQVRSLQVANQGTGPLTIGDAGGSSPGSGFTLTDVPGPVFPNGCGDLRMSFTGPATPGTTTATYTAITNDTTAQLASGHNRRVALAATTRRLRTGAIVLFGERDAGAVFLVIDPVSGVAAEVSTSDRLPAPGALALEPDGSILVACGGPAVPASVVRIDPVSGAQKTISSRQLLQTPRGLVVEADGNVLVSDSGAGAVIRVNTGTGNQVLLSSGGFRSPSALARARDGKVLLLAEPSDFGSKRLFRLDPSTGTVAALAADGFFDPAGVAEEADGKIVVANTFRGAGGGFTFSQGEVIRVDPASGARATLTFSGSFESLGIAVEDDRNIVVAASLGSGGSGVIRVDPVSGSRTTLFAGSLFRPRGIAVARRADS